VAVTKFARMTPRPAPVRTIEIVLDGDYAGWWARCRTNHTFGVTRAMTGDDEEKRIAALAQTILEWNWVDEHGNPIPQPVDGGLDACDAEALGLLLTKWQAMIAEDAALPKA
jgi:hypothetical protein